MQLRRCLARGRDGWCGPARRWGHRAARSFWPERWRFVAVPWHWRHSGVLTECRHVPHAHVRLGKADETSALFYNYALEISGMAMRSPLDALHLN
jgi:hypothetical protein